MTDSKQRALVEELRALQQQNQRLKDAMAFQEVTLRKQIKQKNKIYAVYLNLKEGKGKESRVLDNSLLSDSKSVGEGKLMGSFRSTEPDSGGKDRRVETDRQWNRGNEKQKQRQKERDLDRQRQKQHKLSRVTFKQLQIIVDHGEVKSTKGKSIQKTVVQQKKQNGYSTLKQLRQIQENRDTVGNVTTTPVARDGRKKKSYLQKLAEQNSA